MTLPATAPALPEIVEPLTKFVRRILALLLRHAYLHIGSWPRIIEMLYWPIVNMTTWGFTSLYLVNKFTDAQIISSTLVASVILVEVFVRFMTTMLMLFLEEIWSRNLGHLFASPIKFAEYFIGITLVAAIRTTIAMTPAIILAKILFGFSLFSLGWAAGGYIILLAISSCWYAALIIAMLLHYGLAGEWMAWMATWLLVPLIAPYYPVSVLPHAVQTISYALPQTYVFESLKGLISQGIFDGHMLLVALGLNIIYAIIAAGVLTLAYQGARRRGGLLQMGE